MQVQMYIKEEWEHQFAREKHFTCISLFSPLFDISDSQQCSLRLLHFLAGCYSCSKHTGNRNVAIHICKALQLYTFITSSTIDPKKDPCFQTHIPVYKHFDSIKEKRTLLLWKSNLGAFLPSKFRSEL